MKLKKCKICKEKFEPIRQLQPTCENFDCMIEYANKHLKNKSENNKKQSNIEKMKYKQNDKTHLKKVSQSLINKYSRLRDQYENGYRCCTCGHTKGQMDGGHFLPTSGYSAIRYNTNQIHQQCKNCNRFNGGMPKEYRLFMINKYGLEYVENLENTRTENGSYSVEYYKKLIRVVRKKLSILEAKLLNK